MRITLLYFSWVRERIGKGEEPLEVPPGVTTISEVLTHLESVNERYRTAFADRNRIRAALNEDTASLDATLSDGDELALFPPMTGGQTSVRISVQEEDFDVTKELTSLNNAPGAIGATALFTGQVRQDGADVPLTALHLDCYQSMAEKALQKIAHEACARWPLIGLTIIHRYGTLKIGAQIVMVAATSSHRQAAFDATHFIMDFLKTDAPFWKREERADGSAGWVDAKFSDDVAKDRWS